MAEEKAPQAAPAPAGDKVPEPKWLFYVLSVVVGLFGIIFGIIYMTKDGAEVKKFGKICLIIGIVVTALPCLCWLIMMVFGIGSSLLGGSGTYEYYSY